MLAWLNMGIIPPHLRVVTYQVAARGGGGEQNLQAWSGKKARPAALRFFGNFPNVFGGQSRNWGG
jgi:hypothetical protein